MAAQKYKPSVIRQERLKALVAARTLSSRDGSALLPRPAVREEILTASVLRAARPGELVEGEGIYVGQWKPADGNGKSLGKIFNVYAAPEDMPLHTGALAYTFNEAVTRLAHMKNWHGHDGAGYDSAAQLTSALGDGSYNGAWVMPPYEILGGGSGLRSLRDTGAFKGTFRDSESGDPDIYWSSTPHDIGETHRRFVPMSLNMDGAVPGDSAQFLCRPVRFVPAS